MLLFALHACSPCQIYTEIFSPWGATLSAAALPESLDGATYQQVRRSFDEVSVAGNVGLSCCSKLQLAGLSPRYRCLAVARCHAWNCTVVLLASDLI